MWTVDGQHVGFAKDSKVWNVAIGQIDAIIDSPLGQGILAAPLLKDKLTTTVHAPLVQLLYDEPVQAHDGVSGVGPVIISRDHRLLYFIIPTEVTSLLCPIPTRSSIVITT